MATGCLKVPYLIVLKDSKYQAKCKVEQHVQFGTEWSVNWPRKKRVFNLRVKVDVVKVK